jgi:hypothetical protein
VCFMLEDEESGYIGGVILVGSCPSSGRNRYPGTVCLSDHWLPRPYTIGGSVEHCQSEHANRAWLQICLIVLWLEEVAEMRLHSTAEAA